MIPVPAGVRVWIATGVTDMRRGMNGLSLQVQQGLGRLCFSWGMSGAPDQPSTSPEDLAAALARAAEAEARAAAAEAMVAYLKPNLNSGRRNSRVLLR